MVINDSDSDVSGPPSATKLKRIQITENKMKRLQVSLQATQCIWETSAKGAHYMDRRTYRHHGRCCSQACNSQAIEDAGGVDDLTILVSRMRSYYASLSREHKREWWVQRAIFYGYEKENLRKHSRTTQFVCEGMDVLKANFLRQDQLPVKTVLAPVSQIDMRPSCVHWLSFLSGGNHNTYYDVAARKDARLYDPCFFFHY